MAVGDEDQVRQSGERAERAYNALKERLGKDADAAVQALGKFAAKQGVQITQQDVDALSSLPPDQLEKVCLEALVQTGDDDQESSLAFSRIRAAQRAEHRKLRGR